MESLHSMYLRVYAHSINRRPRSISSTRDERRQYRSRSITDCIPISSVRAQSGQGDLLGRTITALKNPLWSVELGVLYGLYMKGLGVGFYGSRQSCITNDGGKRNVQETAGSKRRT